jgi:DNA-directed RNA polymerase subunit RPC12/RpoP
METPRSEASPLRQFPCKNCGADLQFAPGTNHLACPYCGAENEIALGEVRIEELDFQAAVRDLVGSAETLEVVTARCSNCGAETTLNPNVTADACAFCGAALVLEGASTRLIKPQSLLPFKVKEAEAQDAFRAWLKKLWFAPNAVKRHSGTSQRLAGLYIPHWTYDASTDTRYTGQRGTYYYTTETYTATENGKPVTRTRQVRHTSWSPASGRVYVSFDDVLVCASETLPAVYRPRLGPPELKELVPYSDAYLSGFRTEHYTIGLEDGFRAACENMQPQIDQAIRSDIGGDEQRILHKDTRYHDVTFKHILVPLWLSTYRFKEKPYRFVVDARTGQVQGERPWSAVKIALAVLAVLLVVLLIVYLSQSG